MEAREESKVKILGHVGPEGFDPYKLETIEVKAKEPGRSRADIDREKAAERGREAFNRVTGPHMGLRLGGK